MHAPTATNKYNSSSNRFVMLNALEVEDEENFKFLLSFFATFADQIPNNGELKD